MNIFTYLPTVLISKVIGILVVLPAPHALWQFVIRLYCNFYKVNLDEAEFPLTHYKNLSEFFVRNLKAGARPIAKEFASPVDGTLRNVGKVTDTQLPQIKGKHYSLTDFLGDNNLAQYYHGGTYLNFYLSPRDYHHVHTPLTGQIRKVIYQPGRLYPVNDHSMSTVDNLFGKNERVAFIVEDQNHQQVAIVMIGALNVGKISLAFDAQLSSRISASPLPRAGFTHSYNYGEKLITIGDKLGTFHLGSSVVLLYPPAVALKIIPSLEPRSVYMGSSLLELCNIQP